jgi:two-component system, NtrC family, response regulator AtoC
MHKSKRSLKLEAQSMIDLLEHPFVLIDDNYTIVAANAAYCQAYGMQQDQIVGRRCHEVSHHSPVPCHENGENCPHRHAFLKGENCEVFHTHLDNTNKPEHVRISGYALRSADGRQYLGEAIYRLAKSQDLNREKRSMIGSSPAFLRCLDKLTRAARSEAPVLLIGESGVGKELAAHYLHQRSTRCKNAFVALNCASIPETMFESELFGHERGAFTGSVGAKQGLFELANGGTLFLDEVAEIPFSLQAKLLRALESGEYRRMGGTKTLFADVHIISATHRDLLEETNGGKFRHDLYYRIAGIDIVLPPMRERRSDIPSLAEYLLMGMSSKTGTAYQLTENAMAALMRYDYPGNVRELKNILLKAIAHTSSGLIRAEHVRFALGDRRNNKSGTPPAKLQVRRRGAAQDKPQSFSEIERSHIIELLDQYGGHRRSVAQALDVTERTLYRKLKRYDLSGL